jgi:uncharacterized protein (DUF849 family)
LIKACINGARQAGSHQALPITPEEAAKAARDAVAAGAGAVHVHVRGPDGRESLSPGDVAATVRAIHAAVPGVPVGVSTGAWILRDVELRAREVANWKELPDFASVNWSEDGAQELARELLDMGVAVEVGLFQTGDSAAFVATDLARSCIRALVEVRTREGIDAVDLAASMDAILAGLGIPILHHGFQEETWRVLEAALKLGRDIRIGLEDTFTLPDGSPSADNAALVRAAADMARRLGREPVVPGRR